MDFLNFYIRHSSPKKEEHSSFSIYIQHYFIDHYKINRFSGIYQIFQELYSTVELKTRWQKSSVLVLVIT